jgi:hypothetical protein
MHTRLAELLGVRYEDSAPGQGLADLDAAIAHAREGLRCYGELAGPPAADIQAGQVIELRTMLGILLADRFGEQADNDQADRRVVAAARADRDEAIAILDLIHRTADFDPYVVTVLGRLHRARHLDKWADRATHPGDLTAAIALLTVAAELPEPEQPVLEELVLLLSEQCDETGSAPDRDAFIRWGEFLVRMPGPADGYDGEGVREMLAYARLDRAGKSPDGGSADQEAAITHLEAEFAALPDGDPGRADLASILTDTC